MRQSNQRFETLVADLTRARELLGWEPQVRLAEGFPRTAAWYAA